MSENKAEQEATSGREKKGKQAVVIIHGIGEQKPMDTLRGFVDAVWTSDDEVKFEHSSGPPIFSKPDHVSDSFELRRLTTSKGRDGGRTDFFEFYWAHMLQRTSLSHLLDWFRFLMLRRPTSIPGKLFPHYLFLWVVAIVYVVLAYRTVTPTEWFPPFVSVTIGLTLVPILFWFLKNVLGDAARYLMPTPQNVQRRQEIRSAGVELLKALHDKKEYDRIIIVGHSLGTVIAYDIITHAWVDYNRAYQRKARGEKMEALESLEELSRNMAHPSAPLPDVEVFQAAQRAYFEDFRGRGGEWLVSDFISMGSPLAHAKFLLAGNDEEFAKRIKDREYPACPPVLEETENSEEDARFSYRPNIRDENGKRGWHVPHHAAPFSVTRWTNLYFPVEAVLWGDFIAGPLSPVFGEGIRDIPVYLDERKKCGFFSHTRYWKMPADGSVPPQIAALRESLDLANARGRKQEVGEEKSE